MATAPQGIVGKPRFGPSDGLIASFRACSRNPTEAIATRLKHMLHVFLKHHGDNGGNENTKELAAKCCQEAPAWYYRILENLISQERKRLGVNDISGILQNDLLQRSLVACCLEIAISTNHLSCSVTVLLQIFKLSPYHLWKVIEPVLRAGAGLPRAVVRHLAQVEEKVLESLVWTSDSPLWEEIRANEGRLPTYQQVMLPGQLEDPSRADLQPDPRLPPRGTNSATLDTLTSDLHHSPSAVNGPQRSSALHLFARKVYSLKGKRLRELCSMLDICDELRLKIWTCFEHSLVHCTRLMAEHHLDQLLMCAIYIIARITEREILFTRIMECYKSLPHTSKSVYKNVLISGGVMNDSSVGNNNSDQSDATLTPNTPSTHYPTPCQEERGNLIYYYNQVYRTNMKRFAKQFAPTSGRDTPPLSPYPQQWKAAPHRQWLSSSHSIFISQHNRGTSTPRTSGLCYYFNSSTSECLREINNMIRTGRSPGRRGHAVSVDIKDEEEEDEGEEGPLAKRLCLDGQSAWQRRLRNVANDRITKSNLN